MLFLTFFLCGVLILGIGVFLYKSKKIEILSGYDITKEYDREGLAKFDGKNLMYIGGLLIVLGFLNLFFKYDRFFIISLIIFFILIMVLVMVSVKGSGKYILSENENSIRSRQKQNKLGLIVILVIILVTIIPIGIIFGIELNGKTEVSVNGKEVKIKSGLESTSFNFNDIKKVYIKNTIPNFSKISGLNMEDINRGRFNVSGYGDGYIFLETNRGPYLYVMLKDGFVIINSKDASKVNGYYHKISNK
ncbi:DUF3784 domain-containing protein [Clostridium guangxiense]|uniref:DUF3784 domain-containing protein n=1 Tax=Clostridium guangxiense TaxID=1662055 RepID=UPI001E57C11E|nr:DUF3784 domain-containing protein [Clostridium guangxiense]MCD2347769.1 DUF3784 domain-containing protein [Clostridium guangxiense]